MTDNLFAWIFKTTIGWCGVVGSGEGLKTFTMGAKRRADLAGDLFGVKPLGKGGKPAWLNRLLADLDAYFAGRRPAFEVPLALEGVSDFYKKVYKAARAIPYGEVRTYGWLAARAGRPGAARAVGGAMASNPVPIIVPCHRVVRADGGLGGFSAPGGTRLKRKLLDLESGS